MIRHGLLKSVWARLSKLPPGLMIGFCEGGVLQDSIQECHPFGSGFIGERSPSGDIKLLGCVIVQPQPKVLKQHMVGNGQVWAGMCEL